MKIDLLGHLPIDSTRIFIIDPRILIVDPVNCKDAALIVNTKICGGKTFPVYFEKDDAEGGYGKSRIIIELGPADSGEGYPKYVAKNKHG